MKPGSGTVDRKPGMVGNSMAALVGSTRMRCFAVAPFRVGNTLGGGVTEAAGTVGRATAVSGTSEGRGFPDCAARPLRGRRGVRFQRKTGMER